MAAADSKKEKLCFDSCGGNQTETFFFCFITVRVFFALCSAALLTTSGAMVPMAGPGPSHISMGTHTMQPFRGSATSHASLSRIITLCTARSPQPSRTETQILPQRNKMYSEHFFYFFFLPAFELG